MRTELTQSQYRAVTGSNPSAVIGNNRPVETVSWYEAIEFCNRMSMMKGLTPCYSVRGSTDVGTWGRGGDEYVANDVEWDKKANGWRLPTEEEWFKAADDDIGSVSWYNSNSNGANEVAITEPNGKGLYDMCNNVWEWCWDRYSVFFFAGSRRLLEFQRGRCSVSYRGNTRQPDARGDYMGFRLFRNAK
jgi:formylglycine-generating enzyme required for sulfatase activity